MKLQNGARLDKLAIESLIPHTGTMCLLDSVEQWDEQAITCISASHHRCDNPLREAGKLSCAVLIEYAAQAAAIHAALTGSGIGAGRTALIGAVKALQLHRRYVSVELAVLTIIAQSILQSGDGAIYQIAVQAGDDLLIEARVVLVVPPAAA